MPASPKAQEMVEFAENVAPCQPSFDRLASANFSHLGSLNTKRGQTAGTDKMHAMEGAPPSAHVSALQQRPCDSQQHTTSSTILRSCPPRTYK